MLTLKEFMELVDCRITEGSDYFTNIPNLYCLTSWNGEQDGYSLAVVFDPKDDQRVYMVEACDYARSRAYRLVDPALEVDDQAWDDTKWTTLEADDDFIQKALAIKSGDDYDTRISIPLNMPDDVLFTLMKQAHEQDITFNQHLENILRDKIQEMAIEYGVADDDVDEFFDDADDGVIENKPSAKTKKSKKKKR